MIYENIQEELQILKQLPEPVVTWFRANKRELPWRDHPDAYRVWVSEIMLQQTRVEAVKSYYQRFLEALPDVKALAGAEEDQLLKLCAYGRTRDKHILRKAFSYLGIIILFAVGAALGGHFIPVIAARTIWISCGLLIVSFLFMFIREEVEEHPELLADEKAIKESFHNIKEETLDVTHILEDDIKSSRKDK